MPKGTFKGLTKDQKFVFYFMLAIIIILAITLTWTSGTEVIEIVHDAIDDCNPEYDVNGDGKVNFQDAGIVWEHRTNITAYNSRYDMDCDGDVDNEDANIVWRHRT